MTNIDILFAYKPIKICFNLDSCEKICKIYLRIALRCQNSSFEVSVVLMLRTRVFCDVMLRSRTHSANQTQKSAKQQRMSNPYFSIQCQIFEIIHLLQINVRFQKLPSGGLSSDCTTATVLGTYLKGSTATVLGAT
jgi:hypothetical protein